MTGMLAAEADNTLRQVVDSRVLGTLPWLDEQRTQALQSYVAQGMPTAVVVGTSLFQIIFVTAFTTIVQATTNYAVDIVLAGLLMIAGVIGAQYGVRVGQRMRGEQLRAGLALLVLAVGIRLGLNLVLPPDEIYSIVTGSFG